MLAAAAPSSAPPPPAAPGGCSASAAACLPWPLFARFRAWRLALFAACAVLRLRNFTAASWPCMPASCSQLAAASQSAAHAAADALKKQLSVLQGELGCDLAVQRDGATRRNKRLVVMDMDSTLIQNEVIDEIARCHGVYEEVAEVTERAMNGELDFEESLHARVACLKGCPESVLDDVYEIIELTPGADDSPVINRDPLTPAENLRICQADSLRESLHKLSLGNFHINSVWADPFALGACGPR